MTVKGRIQNYLVKQFIKSTHRHLVSHINASPNSGLIIFDVSAIGRPPFTNPTAINDMPVFQGRNTKFRASDWDGKRLPDNLGYIGCLEADEELRRAISLSARRMLDNKGSKVIGNPIYRYKITHFSHYLLLEFA